MKSIWRPYLFAGLLTLAFGACGGEGDQPFDDESADDDQQRTSDDGDDDDSRAIGRDAGKPSTADAGVTSYSRDAGNDAATMDAGASTRDAGAQTDDAGTPSADVCPETTGWAAQASAFEDEVLVLTNAARAAGHDCGTRGRFGAAQPLAMEAKLRCAARLHTKYMATTGDFSHDQSATGKDLTARIRDVGYRASTWGENIAYGQRTPREVVDGWLESDGHCANIMNPAYKQIGVGYYTGARSTPYWTQDFGASR